MNVRQNQVSSALFAVAAAAYLGIWYILLFTSLPSGVSVWQNAASFLHHAFIESGMHWYFVFLAVMPVVLLCLAVAAWWAPSSNWRVPSLLSVVALAATTAMLFTQWRSVAIFCGTASYLVIFRRPSANPSLK